MSASHVVSPRFAGFTSRLLSALSGRHNPALGKASRIPNRQPLTELSRRCSGRVPLSELLMIAGSPCRPPSSSLESLMPPPFGLVEMMEGKPPKYTDHVDHRMLVSSCFLYQICSPIAALRVLYCVHLTCLQRVATYLRELNCLLLASTLHTEVFTAGPLPCWYPLLWGSSPASAPESRLQHDRTQGERPFCCGGYCHLFGLLPDWI